MLEVEFLLYLLSYNLTWKQQPAMYHVATSTPSHT